MKVWAFVAVAVLLTACGSSSKHQSAVATTGPSAAATTPSNVGTSGSSATPNANEFAVAASTVLQPSDLPAGWKATDHRDTGAGDDRLDQQIGQCMGVTRTVFSRADESAEAHSPDFSLSTKNQQVTNTVKVATTRAAASRAWQPLDAQNFPTCLQQAFTNVLGSVPTTSGSPPKVSVDRLAFPTMLDRTSAFRVTTTVSVSGFTVTVVGDYVFMERGRALAEFTFSGGSSTAGPSPFDAGLERQLATTVARRIDKSNLH